MERVLKDPDILKKKPNLKLRPCHYIDETGPNRVWQSAHLGTAKKSGNGYVQAEDPKIIEKRNLIKQIKSQTGGSWK